MSDAYTSKCAAIRLAYRNSIDLEVDPISFDVGDVFELEASLQDDLNFVKIVCGSLTTNVSCKRDYLIRHSRLLKLSKEWTCSDRFSHPRASSWDLLLPQIVRLFGISLRELLFNESLGELAKEENELGILGSLCGIEASMRFVSVFLTDLLDEANEKSKLANVFQNVCSELNSIMYVISGMLRTNSFDLSYLVKKTVQEKLIDMKSSLESDSSRDLLLSDLFFLPSLNLDVWTGVRESLLKYAQPDEKALEIDFSGHLQRIVKIANSSYAVMKVAIEKINLGSKSTCETFSEDIVSMIRLQRFLPRGNATLSVIAHSLVNVLAPAFYNLSSTQIQPLSSSSFTTLLSFSIELYEASQVCLQSAGILCLLMGIHLTAGNLTDVLSPKMAKKFLDRIGIFQEGSSRLLAMRCMQCILVVSKPVIDLKSSCALNLASRLSKSTFSLSHHYVHTIADFVIRRRGCTDLFVSLYGLYGYIVYLPPGVICCQISSIVELLATSVSALIGPAFADDILALRSLSLSLTVWQYLIQNFPDAVSAYKVKAFIEVGKIKKLCLKKTSIVKLRTEGSVALPLIENSIENTSIITNIWDDILRLCKEIHLVIIV